MHSKPDKHDIESIIPNFLVSGKVLDSQKLGEGHINDTFLISMEYGQQYVLQRINHHIFKNVPALMQNISRVCAHIHATQKYISPESALSAPEIINAINGSAYFYDSNGHYWRCMTYIAHQPSVTISPQIAREGGRAIGVFQKCLSTLAGEDLFDTIPHFHNLRLRLDALHQAAEANIANRLEIAQPELDALMRRETEMLSIHAMESKGAIPLRVVHNDTKLNNVLFDDNGIAIAIVDLDTVMNGSVLYDFGDAVRTLCNTAKEDESNLSLVSFNHALFDAFADGYLSQTSGMLLPIELDLLAFSCKLLPYIMAVRFLTDFLLGDIYYKTNSPMQNLHRTKNQIKFLGCVENSYPALEQSISRLLVK
jgi:serine/threonine protein kinase